MVCAATKQQSCAADHRVAECGEQSRAVALHRHNDLAKPYDDSAANYAASDQSERWQREGWHPSADVTAAAC